MRAIKEVTVRFKGFLLTLALVLSTLLTLPAAAERAGARVVPTTRLDDRLVELSVHSPAVGHDVGVRLLPPPDFDRHPHRTWPTLYLLHGCHDGDTGFRGWTDRTDAEELSAHTNVLIVMPEGGPAGFYSDWLAGPRWETFPLTELRRIVEHDYRSGPQRAVAGLSTGGFGAPSYAARHPGFVRSAASFSGVAHPTYRGPRSTRLVFDLVRGTGADPLALWGDPVANAGVWAAHNPHDPAGRLRGMPVYLSAGNGEAGPFDPPGSGVDGLEQLLGERALHRSFPMIVGSIG